MIPVFEPRMTHSLVVRKAPTSLSRARANLRSVWDLELRQQILMITIIRKSRIHQCPRTNHSPYFYKRLPYLQKYENLQMCALFFNTALKIFCRYGDYFPRSSARPSVMTESSLSVCSSLILYFYKASTRLSLLLETFSIV